MASEVRKLAHPVEMAETESLSLTFFCFSRENPRLTSLSCDFDLFSLSVRKMKNDSGEEEKKVWYYKLKSSILRPLTQTSFVHFSYFSYSRLQCVSSTQYVRDKRDDTIFFFTSWESFAEEFEKSHFPSPPPRWNGSGKSIDFIISLTHRSSTLTPPRDSFSCALCVNISAVWRWDFHRQR